MAAISRSAKYYQDNEKARKKHVEYQKEYNKKKSQVKKRVELNRENRRLGTYGNGDDMDVSHHKGGMRLEKQSKNRGDKNNMPGDKRARGKK